MIAIRIAGVASGLTLLTSVLFGQDYPLTVRSTIDGTITKATGTCVGRMQQSGRTILVAHRSAVRTATRPEVFVHIEGNLFLADRLRSRPTDDLLAIEVESPRRLRSIHDHTAQRVGIGAAFAVEVHAGGSRRDHIVPAAQLCGFLNQVYGSCPCGCHHRRPIAPAPPQAMVQPPRQEMIIEQRISEQAIAQAAAAFLSANAEKFRGPPGRDGTAGQDGQPGRGPSEQHVAAAVHRWLEENAGRLRGRDGTDGQRGADGQPGPPGPAPSQQQIVAGVNAWLDANADQLRGADGASGPEGRIAVPSHDQLSHWFVGWLRDNPELVSRYDNSADIEELRQAVSMLIDRLESIESQPSPSPPPSDTDLVPFGASSTQDEETLRPTPTSTPGEERRLLYFTSTPTGCCGDTDAQVDRLKSRGYPITIIDLNPTETEVRGVPRLHQPGTNRTIAGQLNVATYLSQLIP